MNNFSAFTRALTLAALIFPSAAYCQPQPPAKTQAAPTKAQAKALHTDLKLKAQGNEAYLSYMRGLLYEYEGNMEKASESYLKVIALDPKAYYVQRQAVRVLAQTGKLDKAYELTSSLVQNEAGNSDNWTLFGAVLWERGDKDNARKAYEKAIALNPENTEALYQAAQLSKAKDSSQSIDYLRRYIQARPEEAAQGLYDMALLKYKDGDYAKAESLLKESIERDGDFLQSRYALAQLYEVKTDTAAALAQYLSIEPMDGHNAALLAHIGELYVSTEKEAEAQSYFEKAKAADPANSSAAFWLAVLAERRGDYAAAAQYLRAGATYEQDPGQRMRYSYYLTQTGRYGEAVTELENAYKKWPDNEELGYFLALGFDDIGHTDKALEVLKKIVAAKPNYREARMQYGILSEKTNDIAAAEAQFKALLQQTPDDALVLNYLGYSLADRGLKLDEAGAYIKKAVELAPGNGAYLDSLGWYYFKTGKYDEAYDNLTKAASLVGNDETIWLHLGEVFEKRGENVNSWFSYKFSQLLKADQKGLPEKAEKAEKRIPSSDRAGVYAQLLSKTYPHINKLNALCKLKAEGGMKSIELDAILSYSTSAVSLDLMGPMFTPVIGFHLAADENGKTAFSVKEGTGGAGPELEAIAERMLKLLYDYYSGSVYAEKAEKFSGSCLKTEATEICLAKEAPRPESLERGGKGKVVLEPAYSKPAPGRLPDRLTVKSGGLTVTISVTRQQPETGMVEFMLPQGKAATAPEPEKR